jgi:adenylate cyclase
MKKTSKISTPSAPGWIALGTILLVLFLFWLKVPILELVELKSFDLRFIARGLRIPQGTVALALIDEKSLDVEGRWPWPRVKLAQLVDILSREGARIIAFDIGFLEKDENSHLLLLQQLELALADETIHSPQMTTFLAQKKLAADNDLALAKAIQASKAPVVLGYFFHMLTAQRSYDMDPASITRQLNRIRRSRYPLIQFEDPQMKLNPFLEAYAPETNIAILSETTPFAGYFNMTPDRDGIIRWTPLAINCQGDLFPSLAVTCVWLYEGAPNLIPKVATYGARGIQIGERFIPTDEQGQFLINYLGPPRTFTAYSITDILKGAFPPQAFKGKIILVGPTAEGIYDYGSTPFSPVHPGIEVHATIIENMLGQDFLRKPKWGAIFDLTAILFLGLLAFLGIRRLNALAGAVWSAGLLGLHIFLTRWLFMRHGLWLNMVYPLSGLILTYTALNVYYYFTEEKERIKIKKTFRHYAPPDVIEEMLKHPERLYLGGEMRELTVLFCDLVKFTDYTEKRPPQEVVHVLSRYFELITEQVFAQQGTLKEYVGDQLLALFGAPVSQADHAQRACRAALAMQASLQAADFDPPLSARIGINSGRMLVGNLGSSFRFSYGALGDDVNLGSRLEGLNKLYGSRILMGENTARLLDEAFVMREIDAVRVKGRRAPLKVFELIAAAASELPAEQRQALDLYAKGLKCYRRQKWDEAITLFAQGAKLLPQDRSFRTMASRCKLYKRRPPPRDWDGVFRERRK